MAELARGRFVLGRAKVQQADFLSSQALLKFGPTGVQSGEVAPFTADGGLEVALALAHLKEEFGVRVGVENDGKGGRAVAAQDRGLGGDDVSDPFHQRGGMGARGWLGPHAAFGGGEHGRHLRTRAQHAGDIRAGSARGSGSFDPGGEWARQVFLAGLGNLLWNQGRLHGLSALSKGYAAGFEGEAGRSVALGVPTLILLDQNMIRVHASRRSRRPRGHRDPRFVGAFGNIRRRA